VNVTNDPAASVESISETSNIWRNRARVRSSASPQSSIPVPRSDRYMLAAFGLMLLVLISIGAAGYAGIRGTLAVADLSATDSHLADANHEAAPNHFTTPAVALGLIAALLLAVAVAPARIKTGK
jgi:hypothetical protein